MRLAMASTVTPWIVDEEGEGHFSGSVTHHPDTAIDESTRMHAAR